MRDEQIDEDRQERGAVLFEPTGVPGLDEVLGGGLQRGTLMLVLGPPGSGKTTLAGHMAFSGAQAGRRALIVTALSEAPTKLISFMSTFRFFDHALTGDALQVHTLPRLTAQREASATEAARAVIEAARAQRASIIVLDGFSGLRPEEGHSGRQFLYTLGTTLGALGITMVVTSATDSTRPLAVPEATTADVIIGLRYFVREARARRALEAIKVRGAAQLTGLHGLALTADGVRVWPRLEARVATRNVSAATAASRPPESLEQPYVLGRAAFGLPELDHLLHGGITRGTSTLLAGSPGTGKTLLALHFAAASLRAAEPVVYVTLQESREQLLLKASMFGLGEMLRTALDDGRLVVDALDPVELDPDEIADRLLTAIDRIQAQRLVIDTISDLERIVTEAGDANRVNGFLVALLRILRRRGLTGLFTRPTPQLIASNVDFTDAAVSVLAENVLFLQQVRIGNRLARALSVVKMSFSQHDSTIREITIAPGQGIRVLQPFESGPSVYSGIERAARAAGPRRGQAAGRRDDGK